jgi:ferric-dicitrate binding protein FerR (iron transport regulator)
MAEMNPLPENDQDLMLARVYGRILDESREAREIVDPLFVRLFAARNYADRMEAEARVSGSSEVWNALESAISDAPQRPSASIYELLPSMRWISAVAAVLLAAVSLFLYLYLQPDAAVLIAEAGEQVTIVELADGSSVQLRPNSQLFLLGEPISDHSYRLTGEALFDVVSNPDRRFMVDAGNGRVVVLGTRFNIRDFAGETRVFLFEGQVRFETADRSRSITLAPGEGSVIGQDLQITGPYPVSEQEATGWTENRLIFSNREAGSIFRELEFHFGIVIDAPEHIRREIMGGSITLDNAEQSLGDLASVLGGFFEDTGGSAYRFRSAD